MQLRTRTWCLISLGCFVAACYFWRLGNEHAARRVRQDKAGQILPAPVAPEPARPPAPAPASGAAPASAGAATTNSALPAWTKYRLTNTTRTLDELIRTDQAILLMNALIDTGVATPPAIPEHLRASTEPGAFLVQARGPVTDAFRRQLAQVGVEIISYIPHNSYLVRARAETAAQLRAWPGTQAVLPWEPYYKLAPELLQAAVEQKFSDQEVQWNVLVYTSDRDQALQTLEAMNVRLVAEQRSPFGIELVVQSPADNLVRLAKLSSVQRLEPFYRRVPANDLLRPRLGVATNSIVAENYLGLTGEGVLINVNDTGVDGDHAHLRGRVTADSLFTFLDPDGHGTHVAGTIAASAGEGDATTPDTLDPDGATVPGSVAGASYRGIAYKAKLHALPIDLGLGRFVTDVYLQENAARTNAFISNNSWAYPIFEYDIAAASWDAAVRDALPTVTGSQPLLAVFPAGNSGGGDNSGFGGFGGRINSPGTAKNVITVGAIEQFRNLTNEIILDGETNQNFLGTSDSTNSVASFSGRGNVGIGVESSFGRFKPDVVGPGTWVVSTRSKQWADPTAGRITFIGVEEFQTIPAGETNIYFIFAPREAVELTIQVRTNSQSIPPLPPLLIYARVDDLPDSGDFKGTNTATFPVTVGPWFYALANTNDVDVDIDIVTFLTVTNDPGTELIELKALNDGLGEHFRYESGTSMAAAGISGLLALMQEQLLKLGLTNPSPALMKALLINGARPLTREYDYALESSVNHQGWGLANLTNSLPLTLGSDRLNFTDQTPSNAVATGQSYTRTLTFDTNSIATPLRLTLVWTDPPGNPGAGIKLVNDLDLIVTNLTTGEYFVGNRLDGFFTELGTTNQFETDQINNVENIFLIPPLGLSYSVTVTGRRVNVNAVTTHPYGTVQDFALVISQETNNVASADGPALDNPLPFVTIVTNGAALLNQRAGANRQILVSTNGVTNQWSFYVFDNATVGTNEAGIYAAFTTFLPPNLSRPRFADGDIDMFVSTDSNLTNLNLAAIEGSLRGVKRGGTESVILSNALPVNYYIGIKSEDQQAASFGFFAVSSPTPFSQEDEEGNLVMRGYPLSGVPIPDGDAIEAQAGIMIAFAMQDITIKNVLVTNTITHDQGGDLLGYLGHDSRFALLNNHRSFFGTTTFIWDDSDSGEIPESEPTDGPSSLRTFAGEEGLGPWVLTMIDSAPGHTGRVDALSIRLERQPPELTNDIGIIATILPNRFFFAAVDVPADATNLMVCVTPDAGPVDVFIRRNTFPSQTDFDVSATISPPGDCVNLGRFDAPPLSQGRYFIGVFNPNGVPVNVRIQVFIQRDLDSQSIVRFRSSQLTPILDDALTNSVLFVTNHNAIADLNVGVRLDHERASDLVLHLISPRGTRLLLAENRGGTNATGYGASSFTTNVITTSSGDANASTNVIGLEQTLGSMVIDYQFFNVPDQMRVYYDGVLLFDTGLIRDQGSFSVDFGPGASTNLVITMNEGNNLNTNTLWEYTATVVNGRHFYTVFTENLDLTRLPIKFAVPPFATTNLVTSNVFVSLSDFEGLAAQPYALNQTFQGWTVQATPIEIAQDPLVAFQGSQYLIVSDGRVARPLPTLAGQRYLLRFSYRDPGIVAWWPAEGSITDIAGANNPGFNSGATMPTGYVGRAFSFPGTPGFRVNFDDGPDFRITNSLTLEAWINPRAYGGILFFRGDVRGGYDPYAISVDGPLNFVVTGDGVASGDTLSTPGLIPLNTWTHFAAVLDTHAQTMTIYLDGLPVAQRSSATHPAGDLDPFSTPGVAIGNHSVGHEFPFNGLIDEMSVYARALSSAEIQSIVRAGSSGKGGLTSYPASGELKIDGVSTILNATSEWRTVTIPFTATTNDTLLELTGNPLSLLYDDFQLSEDVNDRFYLPEEPMTPLRGEDAYGEWKLEIWDTRAGGVLSNAYLISWQLEFTFVNTNPPVNVLTNGRCFSGVLENSNTTFFLVNVPPGTTFATNAVTSTSGIDVFFNRIGLPYTNTPGNVLILDDATNSVAVVTTNNTFLVDTNGVILPLPRPPARFIPGQRYYMAVRNTVPTDSNSFTICLNFSSVPNPPLEVQVLTNGLAMTNTISATNLLDYYHYRADSDTVALFFDILNPGGNVDLFARHDLPLPSTTSFDYVSARPARANENISIYDPTLTQLAGDWFLGVINRETLPTTYEIRATSIPAVRLVNGIEYPTTITNQAVDFLWSQPVDYYRYRVSSNAFSATFEIVTNSNNGNVDMYILRGIPPLPSPTNYWFASENPGLSWEFQQISNTAPVRPLTPGDYWIAVVNKTLVPVDYTIRVTEDTMPPSNILPLTNGVPLTNLTSALGTHLYSFLVSPGAVQANFEVLNLTNVGNVDLFVTAGLPLPGTNVFAYASTNQAPTNEFIRVTPGSVVALTPGPWYLAVVDRGSNSVPYIVRATEFVPGTTIVVLTNGIAMTSTVPPTELPLDNGADYYLYSVSTNAVRAQFEILNPSGNVDLYARRGTPLPDSSNYSALSTNTAAQDELIVLFTAGTPVALTPGDWYLSVVNRETLPVTYTVKATEFDLAGTNLMIIRYEFTNSSLCLTWNSLPGVRYYVEGRTNLTSTIWEPVSLTITATDSNTTYCVAFPTPYGYFRVREGLSPLGSPLPMNFSLSSMDPAGFTLRWSASTNEQFAVQWVDSLPVTAWNDFTNVITSTTGQFSFTDDGSQSGGRPPLRFYRVNRR